VAILVVLAFMFTSCSGGSGSVSSSNGTGSVAVLLTDASTDRFSEIWVTITQIELLSDTLHVTIFSDPQGRRINLLDLKNETTLISISNNVPAIRYDKIRLTVSEIKLVEPDPTAPDGLKESYPKLTGNQKIDLNPRMPFSVVAGQMLTIQLDLDAQKSIHIVERDGKTEYNFRPVVFIDIIGATPPEKIVRVSGTVNSIEADKILICSNSDTTVLNDDFDYCAYAYISGDTSFFSSMVQGNPVLFGDLKIGDQVTVIGLYRMDTAKMGVDAVVVEIGEFIEKLNGTIQSSIDQITQQFTFKVDLGQEITSDTGIIPVQIQTGTKIYGKDGNPITDLSVGQVAEIDGIAVMSNVNPDVFNAALILVDTSTIPEGEISGTIENIDYTNKTFDLQTSTVTVCINVPDTATLFLVQEINNQFESSIIDFSDLQNGMNADLYGAYENGCFVPDTIIVYAPESQP
ncbi:MAG: DUF4382 domain-containing protein, partial [bacterium]